MQLIEIFQWMQTKYLDFDILILDLIHNWSKTEKLLHAYDIFMDRKSYVNEIQGKRVSDHQVVSTIKKEAVIIINILWLTQKTVDDGLDY